MKLKKALNDTVIVKHLPPEKYNGMLTIPETVTGNHMVPVHAEVILVGTKSDLKDHLAVGDTVIVPKQFGTRLPNDLIVYDSKDILAVVG